MDTAKVGDYRIVANRLGPDDRALRLEERMPSTDYPWDLLRTIVMPDGVDVAEATSAVRAWLEALWALGYAREPSNQVLMRATDAELMEGEGYWRRATRQIAERFAELLDEAAAAQERPGLPRHGWESRGTWPVYRP